MSERSIWKFSFPITDRPILTDVPVGAEFLSVGAQNAGIVPHARELQMWARVDPAARRQTLRLRVVGTGHPCEDTDNLPFLGTVIDSPFVWHVFLEVGDLRPATQLGAR